MNEQTNQPAIEVIDVHKTFDRGLVVALNGVSLRVMTGEFAVIVGPSGCGKSTLLHLLAALDGPTSGRVVVGGRDLSRIRDISGYRRTQIGLVFQFHDLLAQLSAVQNVQVPMFGTHRNGRQRRRRALELLAEAGLEGKADRRPAELSGGERQRVAIARALANEPSILLADEPTGSLDTESAGLVFDLFRQLSDRRGVTVVMVSHDPSVAAFADTTIPMADGRLVEGLAGSLAPKGG
jgi:putative ABC transport system ATP-binding protein